MALNKITTPRGSIVQTGHGSARLEWDPSFATRQNEQFSRRCSPRVPFDTGMLEKSGKLGTVIGSGEVDYAAPYAAAQYYNTSESRSYDPNRGGQWFERMKASEKEEILDGAEKVE